MGGGVKVGCEHIKRVDRIEMHRVHNAGWTNAYIYTVIDMETIQLLIVTWLGNFTYKVIRDLDLLEYYYLR